MNIMPINQETDKWQFPGKIKFTKVDSTMSRLTTINKIDSTTQINNEAQMTLQVTSTKKKEEEEKKQMIPNLCKLFQKKKQKGQIALSENKAVNESSASLMVN